MPEKTIVDDHRCKLCLSPIPPQLLPVKDQILTDSERETLWQLFAEINQAWSLGGVENYKSSWLEFVETKISTSPNFTAEYSNAASVVRELIDVFRNDAFKMLFFHNGIPSGPPITRLAHAKKFVVDEFIRVQIVLGGFKAFVKESDKEQANYRGYIGGSRYTRIPRVRQNIVTKESD